MAIIIIALSLLPLNDDPSSILLLFSAEPVFAQLSAQGNIGIDNEAGTTTSSSSSITAEQATNFEDFNGGRVNDDRQDNLIVATGSSLDFEDESVTYGEDQISSIPFSSSSSSSTMDFDLFLDSFANSIFNGTSTFGGVGTSIVNGIEVSGITIDKSQNRLSVILSNTATEVGIHNNITGTETTTTTTTSTSPTTAASNSVSIIAMRIPINIADILSMAAASSSSNDNVLVNATGDFAENQDDAFSSDSFSPFSLLSNLQIGSSILIDVDWSEPQMVTMDLVGGSGSRGTSQEQEEESQLNSDNMTTADFVLVSVIPYTGLVNNTTMSSATR